MTKRLKLIVLIFFSLPCASFSMPAYADLAYNIYTYDAPDIAKADNHCITTISGAQNNRNFVDKGCSLGSWPDNNGVSRPAIIKKEEWDSDYWGHVFAYGINYWDIGCPSPLVWSEATHRCEDPSFDPGKNLGPQCPTAPAQNCLSGNPINVAVGNKYQPEVDFQLTPLLGFARYYNSFPQASTYHLGPQWSHTYSRNVQYLYPGTSNAIAIISRAEGLQLTFRVVAGQWQSDADVVGTLVQHTDAQAQLLGWTYTPTDSREVEEYDTLGRLIQVTRSDGNAIVLVYNNGAIQNNANDYLLTKVQDQTGRSLTFAYDANLRLSTIADPAGAAYHYAYDTAGRLASVTYPGGAVRTYAYNEASYTGGSSLPNALTGISNDGVRYATFNYQLNGLAVSTEHAGGVEKFSTQYNSDGSSVTTTPLGTTQQRTFTTKLGVKKPTAVVESCTNCGP